MGEDEVEELPPLPGVALALLRMMLGWRKGRLAKVLALDPSVLSRLEHGRMHLSRERLEELVAQMPHQPGAVDIALESCWRIRAGSEPPKNPEEAALWHLERAALAVGREAAEAARAELARFLAEKAVEQKREQAERAWDRLRRRPEAEWPVLVAGAREYQGWALCERVSAESVKAAADRADRARELARLAVAIAEATPGDQAARDRLQGYAQVHLASAWRVAGDLPEADRIFAAAHALWEQGAAADLPLDPTRILDLEASLRRAQRRFDEALALLDRAVKDTAAGKGTCHLLLNKAFTLEQKGDYEQAISVLREAAPLVEGSRQSFALQFNLVVNLVHVDKIAEADAAMPRVWALARGLGNELDLVRSRWLAARIALRKGEVSQATEEFEWVQAQLARRGMVYDGALSTLELAAIYLQQGRTADVSRLARQTVKLLAGQNVTREALGAVRLLAEAVDRNEEITTELLRDLILKCQEDRHSWHLGRVVAGA
jgi:tetratricopeptide (TPR) repeat protein